MGYRQQSYFQALKTHLMPSIGLHWFGILVLLDLSTYATVLLHFIQYLRLLENNYHPVHSNAKKTNNNFQ